MFNGELKKEFSLAEFKMLPPEVEEGNVEYKLKLLNKSQERLEQLTSQLGEGNGEAIYEIGVTDSGKLVGLTEKDMNESLETLREMGRILNINLSVNKRIRVSESRWVFEVKFNKKEDAAFLEIRVAMLGGADAGKSTLISMLCFNKVDDGKGKGRLNLLRHRHEIESGRSSSLTREIIGFNPNGELINYSTDSISSWEQIAEESSKLITFMDTCGHPKFEKTTLGGLTGDKPEYACIVLAGIGKFPIVSKEQILLTQHLHIPLIIIITKIDVASGSDLKGILSELMPLLKSTEYTSTPVVIQKDNDIAANIKGIVSRTIVPLFLTSCVTFENRDLLIKLFCSLPKQFETPNAINSELEFHIKDVFPMDGLGLVVGGCAVSGRIQISEEQSQVFHIGPDRGKFIPVIIHSIQRQRYSVNNLHAGQSGTFGLKFYGPNEQSSDKTLATENFPPNFKIRRGQVIISQLKKPKCHWKFIADIYILSHTSCLMVGQDLKVYCGTISQMARVYEVLTKSEQPTEEQNGLDDMKSLELTLNIPNKKRRKCVSSSGLIPGSRGKVTLKFLNEPEYLDVNSSVVIKGTGIKCVGRVVSLFENR